MFAPYNPQLGRVHPTDMTSILKVGVTVNSEDDFDLMGDIFYVSAPILISVSQPPERHSNYSLCEGLWSTQQHCPGNGVI